MRLYHFTHAYHAMEILQDGEIKTTDSNLHMDGSGPRCVWLLDTLDPGVDQQHGLNDDKRACVIACEVSDAVRWVDWIATQNTDPTWVRALIASGGGVSYAQHWWVVFRPIPRSEWVG